MPFREPDGSTGEYGGRLLMSLRLSCISIGRGGIINTVKTTWPHYFSPHESTKLHKETWVASIRITTYNHSVP